MSTMSTRDRVRGEVGEWSGQGRRIQGGGDKGLSGWRKHPKKPKFSQSKCAEIKVLKQTSKTDL